MSDGSRGTVLVWVIAAALATLAVVRLLDGEQGSSTGPPVAIDGAAGAGAAASGSSAEPASGHARHPSARASVYVHVAGAVRRPGLLRVATGARVAAAIARAGGPTRRADLAAVNLAAHLQDGQQVVVPTAGAAAPGTAAGAGMEPGVKPSLAGASVEQLEELDGIGPTLAQRIVDYRQAHGGFRSLGELARVDGIGEKRLAALSKALQP